MLLGLSYFLGLRVLGRLGSLGFFCDSGAWSVHLRVLFRAARAAGLALSVTTWSAAHNWLV